MSKTILAVDDDKDILGLVQRTLAGQGFTVTTAEDGHEALEAIARAKPDLVVLDIEMPELDGLEVVAKLRENQATMNLPVILLTAHDTHHDVYKGWRAGADVYLTKPFNPKELIQCVHQIFISWFEESAIPAPAPADTPEPG